MLAFSMGSKGIWLWLTGITLIICWFFTLFEANRYQDSVNIDVDENSLLISLSVLLSGWLIALNLPSASRSPDRRLTSDYLTFIAKIGDKHLTFDQLTAELGEETVYTSHNSGVKAKLSDAQQSSLERLIYEGKISFKNGLYSLPGKKGSSPEKTHDSNSNH